MTLLLSDIQTFGLRTSSSGAHLYDKYSQTYAALLKRIPEARSEDFGPTVFMYFDWLAFYNAGALYANFVVESLSPPKGKAKALEQIVKLFNKSTPKGKGPREGIIPWFDKNQDAFDFLLTANRWPQRGAAEDDESVFVLGPFTVHDTLSLSERDKAAVIAVIDKAVRAMQRVSVPGLMQIAKGRLMLVGELQGKTVAAWYSPYKDLLYLRPNMRGVSPEETARHLIHEVGHRYYQKKLTKEALLAWDNYHNKLKNAKSTGAGFPPSVGFVFPKDIKVRNKQVSIGRYDGGLAYLNDASKGVELGAVPLRQIQTWMKLLETRARFPSPYASLDAQEHFCEALSFKAMGTLAPENEEVFDAIIRGI